MGSRHAARKPGQGRSRNPLHPKHLKTVGRSNYIHEDTGLVVSLAAGFAPGFRRGKPHRIHGHLARLGVGSGQRTGNGIRALPHPMWQINFI